LQVSRQISQITKSVISKQVRIFTRSFKKIIPSVLRRKRRMQLKAIPSRCRSVNASAKASLVIGMANGAANVDDLAGDKLQPASLDGTIERG